MVTQIMDLFLPSNNYWLKFSLQFFLCWSWGCVYKSECTVTCLQLHHSWKNNISQDPLHLIFNSQSKYMLTKTPTSKKLQNTNRQIEIYTLQQKIYFEHVFLWSSITKSTMNVIMIRKVHTKFIICGWQSETVTGKHSWKGNGNNSRPALFTLEVLH